MWVCECVFMSAASYHSLSNWIRFKTKCMRTYFTKTFQAFFFHCHQLFKWLRKSNRNWKLFFSFLWLYDQSQFNTTTFWLIFLRRCRVGVAVDVVGTSGTFFRFTFTKEFRLYVSLLTQFQIDEVYKEVKRKKLIQTTNKKVKRCTYVVNWIVEWYFREMCFVARPSLSFRRAFS